MMTRFGIDQLCSYPDTVTRLAYAALDDVAGAQLLANFLNIDGNALEDKGGISGNNREPMPIRQTCDYVFRDAVSEIFLLGIARQIVKGQNGNGWAIFEPGHGC